MVAVRKVLIPIGVGLRNRRVWAAWRSERTTRSVVRKVDRSDTCGDGGWRAAIRWRTWTGGVARLWSRREGADFFPASGRAVQSLLERLAGRPADRTGGGGTTRRVPPA